MAEAKTKPTSESLNDYLARVQDPERRKDCTVIAALMEEATGEKPVLWGTGIVGFGLYKYKYASGQEGDWPITGFAARKNDLTLYIMPDALASLGEERDQLGKFKTGKSCLYIRRLSDVHLPTLRKLIERGVAGMEKQRIR